MADKPLHHAVTSGEPKCPGCVCCTLNGCYPADGSDCPTDGAGNSECPCTQDDD